MNNLMNYIKFISLAVMTNLRLSMVSRIAFLMAILITVIKQILFLVGWNFFFKKYQMVQGWNFDSMLLMYGTVCFAIGFVEAFLYGLRELPKIIDSNQLDTFLLQPKNIILNLALSRGDMAAVGEMIAGLILIGYSGYFLTTFPEIILILAMSVLFIFSLFLYLGCIAFFTRDANEFIRELSLNAIIMATQPNIAYRGALKMLTLTILPVAFLSFFPIEYLRTKVLDYLFFALMGNIVFFIIACWLFNKGLKRYESGNMIIFRQ